MTEYWESLNGHEGSYSISNFGNIKSIHRNKLLKPYVNPEGYLKFHLTSSPYVSKLHSLHRLVALQFIPNPENKDTVDHIDGNKSNNSVINLQWMTTKENTVKGWVTNYKGRIGINAGMSKLNDIWVRDIKIMIMTEKYSAVIIAGIFGVTPATIHAIKRNETWKHV